VATRNNAAIGKRIKFYGCWPELRGFGLWVQGP